MIKMQKRKKKTHLNNSLEHISLNFLWFEIVISKTYESIV